MEIDLNNYSIEELRSLNKHLVDHIKTRLDRESQRNMERFELGDLVSFDNNGEIIEGKVIRFNKKSITIKMLHCDHEWRVSPQLLSKVIVTSTNCSVFTEKTIEPNSFTKPISRNAPCPCGSGRKYKRCCIN